MPRAYSDAERVATDAYSAEIVVLKQTRDTTIKKLVEGRRSELAGAKEEYDKQLRMALESVTLDPFAAAPDCLIDRSLWHWDSAACDQEYGFGEKVYLSPQLRKLFVHPATIGTFDVRTYNPDNTPIVRNRIAALLAIPIESYQQVPEFSKEIEKAIAQERDRAKLKRGQPLPPEVANAAVVRFRDEWVKGQLSARSYQLGEFGHVTPDFFVTAATLLQAASKRALKSATDKPQSAFVVAKDGINAKYDSQQAEADAAFGLGAEGAERKRAAAVDAAMKRTPPVQETATSLQGEAVLTVPAGDFTIIAEDTTTDQHLRWSIPVPHVRVPSQTIELTDANALRATPATIASPAAQMRFPKAGNLSATERADYSLRYGSRLLKSWTSIAVPHEAIPIGDDLKVVDSPLGFGFQLNASSTSVFNTLRMTDNDIAGRFFKDLVAPYLQALPQDLRTIGGSQAFEAVSLGIIGNKKSFADQYAVSDYIFLTYIFRISDVESYSNQKIDAQQLLDRGHITQGQGRINVRLVSAQ
jgi:hypothetical protein